MQGSKVKISKMRIVAARSKGGHDKLGTKGCGLSQHPNDWDPILHSQAALDDWHVGMYVSFIESQLTKR